MFWVYFVAASPIIVSHLIHMLFLRLDRKDNGSDPAVLEPALDCKCSLIVQYFLERVFVAEYDLAVKSGKVDYEEALVDLLIS